MIRPDPNVPLKDQDPVVLLALTVLGEARNQPYQGKVAVAQVVRNRMDAKGHTVAEVVLWPWQFSCWNAEDPNRTFLEEVVAKQAGNIEPGLWESCLQAAESALGTPREIDPTGGASHYVVAELWASSAAKTKNPPWYSKRCVDKGVTEFLIQIGAHVFAKTKW
jgi:spore germination cell wall hydrolase CwlJ-like protein